MQTNAIDAFPYSIHVSRPRLKLTNWPVAWAESRNTMADEIPGVPASSENCMYG